jgi:hypothetical protein
MRPIFRLVLNLVLMLGLSACQTKSGVEKSAALVNAAHHTYAGYARAINAGEEVARPEIPEKYWAKGIRELKPIKVYTHMVNIVVAQKILDNVEEGKYINIPISSYLPMDGIDGFTFQPNPLKGNQYHLGDGVFDYQRTVKTDISP